MSFWRKILIFLFGLVAFMEKAGLSTILPGQAKSEGTVPGYQEGLYNCTPVTLLVPKLSNVPLFYFSLTTNRSWNGGYWTVRDSNQGHI